MNSRESSASCRESVSTHVRAEGDQLSKAGTSIAPMQDNGVPPQSIIGIQDAAKVEQISKYVIATTPPSSRNMIGALVNEVYLKLSQAKTNPMVFLGKIVNLPQLNHVSFLQLKSPYMLVHSTIRKEKRVGFVEGTPGSSSKNQEQEAQNSRSTLRWTMPKTVTTWVARLSAIPCQLANPPVTTGTSRVS